MKLKIDKKDCLLKNLKVPKGHRVIEDYELLKELRTNKQLQEIFKKGIWVHRNEGTMASWLGDFYDDSTFVAGGRGVGSHITLRGVFVEVKK